MPTPKAKTLKTRSFSKANLLIFAIIFASIGGYAIYRSFAANPNLPGDTNNDGVVNLTDLTNLVANWGTNNSATDFNSDGTVNGIDLSILLAHYGQSGGSGQIASLEAEAMSDPGSGNGGVFSDSSASGGQYRSIWGDGTTSGTVN